VSIVSLGSVLAVSIYMFGGQNHDRRPGIGSTAASSAVLVEKADARMFLHIADTHADPFYDYMQYFVPAPKISRAPQLYSNTVPADECGWQEEAEILEHWNKTGGGPACPCGQYGANPPFSVLQSLKEEIAKQRPEFVIWSGDFASHYEPGTAQGDSCHTARAAMKATVTMVNAHADGIQHIWGWGNNDVLPKRQPLAQDWLEEFGAHLLERGWLKQSEIATWNQGGFYRRNVGKGLCVITLNSNSWTENQINEVHHAAQLKWFQEDAFSSDPECKQYILNAHVPLGWLESGTGHHQWSNLQGAEVPARSEQYRMVITAHYARIVAELYGHINKADIRLMAGKHSPEKDGVGGTQDVSDSAKSDAIGDIDEDISGEKSTVSFTVAGISRRALNDPQFQRIYLDFAEPILRADDSLTYEIKDIEVLSMKEGCDFTFSYSFRDVFAPHFNNGITTKTLKAMVNDTAMREVVESHLAMSVSAYTSKNLTDAEFLNSVRNGVDGCAVREDLFPQGRSQSAWKPLRHGALTSVYLFFGFVSLFFALAGCRLLTVFRA